MPSSSFDFRREAAWAVLSVLFGLGSSTALAGELRLRVPTTPTLIAPISPTIVAPITPTVVAPISTVVSPTPSTTTITPSPSLVTISPTPSTAITTTIPTATTPTTTPTSSGTPLLSPSVTSMVTATPVQSIGQVLTTSANTTLNSSGVLVVPSASATPLVLSASATDKAQIQLPASQAITIASGNTTLSYLDKTGNAQLLVRNPDGAPRIEVGSGQVEIKSSASGNVIPLISDGASKPLAKLTTATASDTVTVLKDQDSTRLFVDSGKVQIQAVGQAAPVAVFQGETGKLDGSGRLLQITLGSPDGTKQLPGDPLPRQSWFAPDTKVIKLDGKLARFDNQVSLLDIAQGAFKDIFGKSGGQLSYDNITGTLTLTVGGTSINLLPVGSSQVVPYSYHAAQTASGAFEYASQGIQITLAGAIGYFNDLIQSIKDLDPAGQVTLKSNGVLEVRANGNRFAALPGTTSTVPDKPVTKPGLEVDASGLVQFRDHFGARQTLYPSFANIDQLSSVAGSAVPGASLSNSGNGSVVLNMNGKSFTLVPEYLVRDLPGNHVADTYWVEGGNQLFLSNGDNTAQGFQVR